MLITKFKPISNFETPFRFLEQALSDFAQEPASARPWSPAVDILENENELVVKADLPEVKLEDIGIHIEDGTLTLKGERKFERKSEKEGYHRIERSYGSFSRRFALPESVDPEKVTADFKEGVLTVTLPKKELAKPRSIKVNIAN